VNKPIGHWPASFTKEKVGQHSERIASPEGKAFPLATLAIGTLPPCACGSTHASKEPVPHDL